MLRNKGSCEQNNVMVVCETGSFAEKVKNRQLMIVHVLCT